MKKEETIKVQSKKVNTIEFCGSKKNEMSPNMADGLYHTKSMERLKEYMFLILSRMNVSSPENEGKKEEEAKQLNISKQFKHSYSSKYILTQYNNPWADIYL